MTAPAGSVYNLQVNAMSPPGRARWLAAPLLVLVLSACAAQSDAIPAGTLNPDRYLFDQAQAAVADEDWLEAQQRFQQLVDGFPQSPLREDARMGLANAFLSQGSAESRVLAAAEFEDFLRFYPTSPSADQAQYGLAMTHYEQMRAPERDQTETRATLAELEAFFARYPDSPLMPEARARWREARDRLSESVYLVGLYYFRTNWLPGATDRFEQVLADDPGYSNRDAVYFYLAESYVRADNTAEAVPYLERLLAEFDASAFRADAERRLQELTVQ